ncbi:MAG: hypothetical protein IGR76_05065 [Synechococcales cyanobacterium T60_A2020_003]|nr:hypothetical protein [Synechococcales cyanobacterium T60_A2020_003]
MLIRHMCWITPRIPDLSIISISVFQPPHLGDRQDLLATIQNLLKRRFAHAGDWSIPLPYPQRDTIPQFIPRSPNVVISVHTKYVT